MSVINQNKPSLEELVHHGVKGQKWGVRKRYNEIRNAPRASLELTTRSGNKVRVDELKTPPIPAAIGAIIPRFKNSIEKSKAFDIFADGKKVGNAQFHEESKDELNLVWLGIKKEQRGKGYASSVFEAGIAYGKQKNYKALTLEVPGNAPDARHIYEKQGFKVSGKTEGDSKTDPMWGGLTPMSYNISTPSKVYPYAVHSSIEDDELEKAILTTFPEDLISNPEKYMVVDSISHSDTKHDLIFFEKRSTPKVISQGKSFTAPETYGKQTKRRAATEDEEKQIARGDWVRVDQSGKKGGEPGYKKTKMAGREHLVHLGIKESSGMLDQAKPSLDELVHYGKKGMKWGVTNGTAPAGASTHKLSRAEAKAEKASFYEKKAASLVNVAAHNPDTSLIRLRTQNGDTIVTGKEFVNHMANGGIMNVKYTEVFAKQEKKGGPLVEQARYGNYQRSDKKKFTTAQEKITANKTASNTTKKVIDDHNNLSNKEFFQKYATTKKSYAKRVKKSPTGDPFKDRGGKDN